MPFISLTPVQHNGTLLLRSEAIQSVESPQPGDPYFASSKSRIGLSNLGLSYVKEDPEDVAALIEAAECCCDCDPECRIDVVDETPLHDDGAAECINRALEIERLNEELAEVRADAKTADERAEWYKQKLAEEKELHEKTRLLAKDRISDLESELKKWQRGDIRYSSLYGFGITHSSYLK